jgi:hypothetical protein
MEWFKLLMSYWRNDCFWIANVSENKIFTNLLPTKLRQDNQNVGWYIIEIPFDQSYNLAYALINIIKHAGMITIFLCLYLVKQIVIEFMVIPRHCSSVICPQMH